MYVLAQPTSMVDSEVITALDQIINFALPVILVAGWLVLQVVILPRRGVST